MVQSLEQNTIKPPLEVNEKINLLVCRQLCASLAASGEMHESLVDFATYNVWKFSVVQSNVHIGLRHQTFRCDQGFWQLLYLDAVAWAGSDFFFFGGGRLQVTQSITTENFDLGSKRTI